MTLISKLKNLTDKGIGVYVYRPSHKFLCLLLCGNLLGLCWGTKDVQQVEFGLGLKQKELQHLKLRV